MKTQTTTKDTFQASKNWEIGLWIFGLLIIALLFASTNVFALTPQFDDEAYIDDIPFDTEIVVFDMMLENEDYIDDIPFNTAWVVLELKLDNSIDFTEEAYIDDLPFNTEKIAAAIYLNTAVAVDYEMEEEAYIDDIPFNTCLIAKTSQNNSLDLMASKK